ncbi:hypothetical protein ACFL2S_16115, partial [Thermodesulfobacteriota bacterium]
MDNNKMSVSDQNLKENIADALKSFQEGSFQFNATAFFNSLGYKSEKTFKLSPNTPENFIGEFDREGIFNKERALFYRWETVDIIYQLTDDEINIIKNGQDNITFDSKKKYDGRIIESYLFIAIDLEQGDYTRTNLSNITREINKLFPMPVLIFFKHSSTLSLLSLSIIQRRLHKRDSSKDVLEKVTLIKDICFETPHRAHIEILHDLSFGNLYKKYKFTNFSELDNSWKETLSINELNKRFYKELSNWYFWALKNVNFPGASIMADQNTLLQEKESVKEHNAKNLIRLLTRILFVWFLKEKSLIPEELFDEKYIKNI